MIENILIINDSEIELTSNYKESEFLKTSLGEAARLLIDLGGFKTYAFGPAIICGKKFGCLIIFKDGVVESFSMEMATGEFAEIPGNENCEGYLKKIKKKNDEFLRSIADDNPPYRCEWGLVESVLDKKACSAVIVVSFKG